MLPYHQQEDISAVNQFSFAKSRDTSTAVDDHGRNTSLHGVDYGAWAERIKGNNGYFGKSNDRKLGAWTRRASFQYDHRNHDDDEEEEDEEFGWLVKKKDERASGTPSPPLWKDVGSPVPRSAGASPLHNRHVDRQLYPTKRAQEIARYRQEMLDLVKDMPESGYELSLRDIVQPPSSPLKAKTDGSELPKDVKKKKKAKDQKKVKQMSRSESMETGSFLLKMFMPVSVGGRKTSTKPPKPAMMLEGEKRELEVDGEWWKKNEFSGSGGSTSSNTSSSSNGSQKSRGW